ncbi:uncharacterized protein E0L32_001210 [Thyridium curvatum]|uniref:Uncharacterized protein n=1 Tax=Thyridium curvatum TaxID=1093900 RepID=A0A507ANA9_9PEZI|nr:uncharacterized protein E0L32_001210 [Thyridium curvatum]TPX11392.1 hypothetical protein E0L32_001210 [Thyridium curvatum]
MSASQNPDAMTSTQGEFRSRVAPSEPLTTKGHAPGVKVGKDAAQEFHAEAYPAGTAPAKFTHQPNPGPEDTAGGQRTSTEALLPGPTSQQIYNETDLGKPIEGQSSAELHGRHKKERSGLEGVGASKGGVFDKVRQEGADLEGRAAEIKGQRGASGLTEEGQEWQGADERTPASAEDVAAERR